MVADDGGKSVGAAPVATNRCHAASGDCPSAADFAKALEIAPVAVIPFEPQLFGPAANNGQMIGEISSGHKTAEIFRQIAQTLTGRVEAKRPRRRLLSPLLSKLVKRKG